MKAISEPRTTTNGSSDSENRSVENKSESRGNPRKHSIGRRAFLGKSIIAGAGAIGVGLLGVNRSSGAPAEFEQDDHGGLSSGDAALLRFPAALELLEADFWIQYNELGGIQDPEVPGGTGNPAYHDALGVLDEDMDQYIHDNTDDEITHHTFLNAYLVSKGSSPANLDAFRTLMGSTAPGVNTALIG